MYHARTLEANGSYRNPYPIYEHNPLNDVRPNPIVGWKWCDETGQDCEKVYPSQLAALKDLTGYIHFLNYGPTPWQRVWWPLRYRLWPWIVRFWNDTSSGTRFDDGGVR